MVDAKSKITPDIIQELLDPDYGPIETGYMRTAAGDMYVKALVRMANCKGKMVDWWFGHFVRGWIGVSVQTVTPSLAESFGMKEPKGALVGNVVEGGPADAAGIKSGDIIVAFNKKEIKTMSDLPLVVAGAPVGSTVPVTIIREGKEMAISLKIAEMPEEKTAAPSKKAADASDFGMTLQDITPALQKKMGLKERSGIVVVDVEQGSRADDAGIEEGDIIIEVNHKPVKNIAEYRAEVQKSRKGTSVLLLVRRGAGSFYASVKTGE